MPSAGAAVTQQRQVLPTKNASQVAGLLIFTPHADSCVTLPLPQNNSLKTKEAKKQKGFWALSNVSEGPVLFSCHLATSAGGSLHIMEPLLCQGSVLSGGGQAQALSEREHPAVEDFLIHIHKVWVDSVSIPGYRQLLGFFKKYHMLARPCVCN